MEDRLRARLADLQREYKQGQEEFQALQKRLQDLQVQLYTYQGAMTILHEMLQPEPSEGPEEGMRLG